MFFKKKRRDDKSQNVKNKVLNMKKIEIKIDDMIYLMIDDLMKEKSVNDCKVHLETDQVIGLLCEKALKEFIRDNQFLITEKLNRELSLIDEKLEGKEILFEEIFKVYDFNPKAKEGD